MGVFVIGKVMKVIAWSIALLVMAINMYLLFVSIFGTLVESTAITVILGVATIFYISFIIYLVLEPAQEDGNWAYIERRFIKPTFVKPREDNDSVKEEASTLVSSTESS